MRVWRSALLTTQRLIAYRYSPPAKAHSRLEPYYLMAHRHGKSFDARGTMSRGYWTGPWPGTYQLSNQQDLNCSLTPRLQRQSALKSRPRFSGGRTEL